MNELENNDTGNYQLTILIPIYNEEENLIRLEEKLQSYLAHSPKKTCVMFINDGSDDNSLSIIKRVVNEKKDFFYISFAANRGLSSALKAGISSTYSDLVGYMDADMQTDPEDFNLLLEEIDKYDLVTGIRVNRQDSIGKKLQSRIANSFRRMMTGDIAEDTGCPLKVLHTSMAKKIPFFNGMHRFIPALILLENGTMKQIPVRHYPRIAGKSKYHLANRLIGPLMDCFAYRWMRSRYIKYNINEEKLKK